MYRIISKTCFFLILLLMSCSIFGNTKTETCSVKYLDSIESQINENTQILKALEHKVDVIKAEQENIKHDIAHIKGDVEAVKKDITNVEVITASNWADIAKLKAVK